MTKQGVVILSGVDHKINPHNSPATWVVKGHFSLDFSKQHKQHQSYSLSPQTTYSQANKHDTLSMQLQIFLAAVTAAVSSLAAPTGKSMMAASTPEWTIESFLRTCDSADT